MISQIIARRSGWYDLVILLSYDPIIWLVYFINPSSFSNAVMLSYREKGRHI